jgi:hypothetical protein
MLVKVSHVMQAEDGELGCLDGVVSITIFVRSSFATHQLELTLAR